MNAELNSDWPLRTARFSLRENGTPVADEFDDIYFSTENGLAETRHVFIEGNDLPTRFAKLDPSSGPFTILETGFGTGLNFLATWQTFLALAPPSARLHFVSIEAHPFYAKDIVRLHKNSELAELARVLAEAWPDLVPGLHRRHFAGGRITLTLGFGDVRRLLPQMDLKADALFLDGFSPARNPAMWQPEVMCLLASLMNVGGSFATFTSARMVKDALAEGGFAFEKAPGYGRKRDMLKGILTRTPQPRRVEPALPMSITGDVGARQAIVIGAGLAGCAITSALAARGWRITLFERGSEPAQAASGNPAGIFLPVLSRDWNALSNLTGSATGYLRSEIARMNASGGDIDWSVCGVLRLARGDKHLAQQLRILETLKPDSSFAQWLTQDQASDLAGVSVNAPGWWFPGCGWVNPPSLCKAWLASAAEATTTHFNKPVFKIEKYGDLWRAFNEQGVVLAEAPVVIVANANEAAKFAATRHLPLIPFRGQISQLPISHLHTSA
ncbi:MAG TPA: FAD-dependent oxidoreductase, partial [Halothiobacillus sp.]|nr:FAD-dependent oxidoreductase [Halothiobacillus sp.]